MSGLIVHEWVEKSGGAERVVDEFVKTFPDADLQVLWSDDPDRYRCPTYETWLARTPLRRHKALALPLLPATWRSVRAKKAYEWILTSSHLFAHHVRPRGLNSEVPKFSYIHTPARYIWEPELDARGRNPLVRAAGSAFKPLDKKRAHETTSFAANSEFTRERIRRAWDVDATVIYPPVDVERILAGGEWRDHVTREDELDVLEALPSNFLLGASRFVPYKRLDLVIEAGEATGLPVVIAGRGPEEASLRSRAASARIPVTFVISPSDELLFALYQTCAAYVFPAVEDFGIMPDRSDGCGYTRYCPQSGWCR